MAKNCRIPLCKKCWYMFKVTKCHFLDPEIYPDRFYKKDKKKLTKKGEKMLTMLGVDTVNNTCETFKSTKSVNYQSNRGMAELRIDIKKSNRRWMNSGNYYGQS